MTEPHAELIRTALDAAGAVPDFWGIFFSQEATMTNLLQRYWISLGLTPREEFVIFVALVTYLVVFGLHAANEILHMLIKLGPDLGRIAGPFLLGGLALGLLFGWAAATLWYIGRDILRRWRSEGTTPAAAPVSTQDPE